MLRRKLHKQSHHLQKIGKLGLAVQEIKKNWFPPQPTQKNEIILIFSSERSLLSRGLIQINPRTKKSKKTMFLGLLGYSHDQTSLENIVFFGFFGVFVFFVFLFFLLFFGYWINLD